MPQPQYYNTIQNTVTTSGVSNSTTTKKNLRDVALLKSKKESAARHNSMTTSPKMVDYRSLHTESEIETGSKLMKERTAAPFFRTVDASQEEGLDDVIMDADRSKFASFSLQVRRRTDQQSNFLSRTQQGNWYNGPVEVDNQRTSTSYPH